MNQLRNFFVLTLLALAPWASGQQLLKPEAFEPETHILKVEFSDPQELAAQGWQQVHDEEWRRTTEDGTETILTFGLTAIEASLTYLDERLEQLESMDKLTAEQETKRQELVQQRASLLETARGLVTRDNDSPNGPLCQGQGQSNYSFHHVFGYGSTAYYFTAASSASHFEFSPNSTGEIYTDAYVNGGGMQQFGLARAPLGPLWRDFVSTNVLTVGPAFNGLGQAFSMVRIDNNNQGCSDYVSCFSFRDFN